MTVKDSITILQNIGDPGRTAAHIQAEIERSLDALDELRCHVEAYLAKPPPFAPGRRYGHSHEIRRALEIVSNDINENIAGKRLMLQALQVVESKGSSEDNSPLDAA